jgi:hypothetical protein
MKNCKNCIHQRVCGHKEKYEQYIEEFNELNKKWDIFQTNPNCPEYTDKNLLRVNQGRNYDYLPKEKDIDTTYDNKTHIKPVNTFNESKTSEADYIYKPIIISLDSGGSADVSLEDLIKELSKRNIKQGRCY